MHIEVFQSAKSAISPKAPQRWYWHFKNKGRITAATESFPTKAHAMRAAKAVVKGVLKECGMSVPSMLTWTVAKKDNITTIMWS